MFAIREGDASPAQQAVATDESRGLRPRDSQLNAYSLGGPELTACEDTMGFAGTGRCDDLEIEVLSPDGDEAWELQLLMATATLRFEIAGPRTLGAILRFVESEEPGWGELEVGVMDRAKVELVRDRESGTSRFWLRVTPDRGFLKLDFADDEARKLVAAVRDACKDLASEAG